jgi:ABC-type antimicrobial peptide transport system permease subunit
MSDPVLLHVREGLRYVARHPLRSALNAVTCAVAIAVTVNVISLNYGMDADIRKDLNRFGARTVDVGRTPILRPGAAPVPFGDVELRRIREAVADLDAVVVPARQRLSAVTGDRTLPRLAVAAVPEDFARTLDIPLLSGRWFSRGDAVPSCVLDESVARALFPERPPAEAVGRTVRWGSDPVVESLVVGVLSDPMTYRSLFDAFDENRGSRTLSTMLLSFRNVYVPPEAIPGTEWSFVSVVLPDAARTDLATARLGRIWSQVDAKDPLRTAPGLSVLRRRDWMEVMGGVTQMGAFLGNTVWILIVLVACVMISTLNLITVRERYDEIAVRRCEGARKRHLVLQIAGENVATSLAGGLLGLPLGWLGAAAMREIVEFPFRFENRYAFAAMGVALVLGLLSSWIPARRAAGLDPARVLSRRLT